MCTFSSVLIQPEEFKSLKFFFGSVFNWCCDADGKSNVAFAVIQTFLLQTHVVKPQRKFHRLPGSLLGAEVVSIVFVHCWRAIYCKEVT